MVVAMLDIVEMGRSVLLVVIERENLERMEKADPITLESLRAGGMMPVPMFPLNFSLLMAYEPDVDEVYRRAMGDRMEFLKWLERGRTWNPERDGKENAFRIRPDLHKEQKP